jgi:hypothetical protein
MENNTETVFKYRFREMYGKSEGNRPFSRFNHRRDMILKQILNKKVGRV